MKPTHTIWFRKFGSVVGYTTLFALASFLMYLIGVKAFSITAIKVLGSNIQVIVDSKRLPNSLLFFPSARIRSELLAANPALVDIEFMKEYPHTLVIKPTLRTPAATLIGTDRSVLLSSDGIVLGDSSGSQAAAPVIRRTLSGIRTGQSAQDKAVLTVLVYISRTRDLLPIPEITIADDGSVRAHYPTLDILFTQNSDVRQVVATLQTLLAGFRIKGTLPASIDLRFDKPVITN